MTTDTILAKNPRYTVRESSINETGPWPSYDVICDDDSWVATFHAGSHGKQRAEEYAEMMNNNFAAKVTLLEPAFAPLYEALKEALRFIPDSSHRPIRRKAQNALQSAAEVTKKLEGLK